MVVVVVVILMLDGITGLEGEGLLLKVKLVRVRRTVMSPSVYCTVAVCVPVAREFCCTEHVVPGPDVNVAAAQAGAVVTLTLSIVMTRLQACTCVGVRPSMSHVRAAVVTVCA